MDYKVFYKGRVRTIEASDEWDARRKAFRAFKVPRRLQHLVVIMWMGDQAKGAA